MCQNILSDYHMHRKQEWAQESYLLFSVLFSLDGYIHINKSAWALKKSSRDLHLFSNKDDIFLIQQFLGTREETRLFTVFISVLEGNHWSFFEDVKYPICYPNGIFMIPVVYLDLFSGQDYLWYSALLMLEMFLFVSYLNKLLFHKQETPASAD